MTASAAAAALELAPLPLAAVLYARRAHTLVCQRRPVPLARQLAFGSGLALVAVALLSPIPRAARRSRGG